MSRAIEVHSMKEDGTFEPQIVPFTSIHDISPVNEGAGCIITFTSGEAVACANYYSDLLEALRTDRMQFSRVGATFLTKTLQALNEEDEDAEEEEDDDDDDEYPGLFEMQAEVGEMLTDWAEGDDSEDDDETE